MTREEVELCSKWEQEFRWAIRSNFVHMSQGEFNEIARLYKDILGVGMNKSQMTCNTCRLAAIKALGNAYFESRDRYIKEDREKEKEEQLAAETTTKNKKGGRPKKINID